MRSCLCTAQVRCDVSFDTISIRYVQLVKQKLVYACSAAVSVVLGREQNNVRTSDIFRPFLVNGRSFQFEADKVSGHSTVALACTSFMCVAVHAVVRNAVTSGPEISIM